MPTAFVELQAAIHRQLELELRYREIIGDNLEQGRMELALSISYREQSGFLTHTATTEKGSLYMQIRADGVSGTGSRDSRRQINQNLVIAPRGSAQTDRQKNLLAFLPQLRLKAETTQNPL